MTVLVDTWRREAARIYLRRSVASTEVSLPSLPRTPPRGGVKSANPGGIAYGVVTSDGRGKEVSDSATDGLGDPTTVERGVF